MVVALLAILALARPTSAQVKYVDEAGVTHYAQSGWMVPERYRAKAKRLGPLPFVSVTGPMQGGSPGGLPPVGNSGPSRIDLEDAENARNMRDAAEKNLAQKKSDEAKKAEFNRCVGDKQRSSPCF